MRIARDRPPQPPEPPVIPFAAEAPWTWPLWPTTDGWLIGGSGYTTGHSWPSGVSPGLGLGAILLPSRLIGTWLTYPGSLPLLDSPFLPTALWLPDQPVSSDRAASASEGSAGPSAAAPPPKGSWQATAIWSKAGLTMVPVPPQLPWPKGPLWLTPWGPVAAKPGPLAGAGPAVSLGFPTADGTPIAKGTLFPWPQVRDGEGRVTMFDLTTRQVQIPPSLNQFPEFVGVSYKPGLLLLGPPINGGRITLLDLLTGAADPLPEIPPIPPEFPLTGASLSQFGERICFDAAEGGQRRVHLFDRRTRMTDRLQRLNAVGDALQGEIDHWGTKIAFVTRRPPGQFDLMIYDLTTGTLDPLPAVNTEHDDALPSISAGGRWLLYVTRFPDRPRARLYDAVTRAIDDLPEINALGPILATNITSDGLLILVGYASEGHLKVALYDRATGYLDPLPELNQPGVNPLPPITE